MKLEELTFTVACRCPACKGGGQVNNPVMAEYRAYQELLPSKERMSSRDYFASKGQEYPVVWIDCLRCKGERRISIEIKGPDLKKLLAEEI